MADLQAEADQKKRATILSGAQERVVAIAAAVVELQQAVAGGPTKDADKQKLAEILSRPEYQPPKAEEESLFQKWWRAFRDWIDSLFPSPEIAPSTASGLGSL